MKICLTKVKSSDCFVGNEYNLSICADRCVGKEIRRNLPKSICGDGVKINFIVSDCNGILPAPDFPCNDLLSLSTPIKVIRKNPCCSNTTEDVSNNFNGDDCSLGLGNIDADYFCNEGIGSQDCFFNENSEPQDCSCNENTSPQEYVIIVRSHKRWLSKFFCKFPQMYLKDCNNTIKLTIIFDRKGSVSPKKRIKECCSSCSCRCFSGCCGGGFGGCGFGGCGFGGGCDCFLGITALALLFCCC